MDIETRKKRILYRASHRGTKEADALVGGFFATRTPSLGAAELDDADRILDLLDMDLMDWMIRGVRVPQGVRSPLFDELMAFGKGRG